MKNKLRYMKSRVLISSKTKPESENREIKGMDVAVYVNRITWRPSPISPSIRVVIVIPLYHTNLIR